MPIYVVLHEFDQENVANMDAQQERGMESLADVGGELHDLYLTFGQYDAVGIVEFPSDEAAAQWLLTQAKENGLSTETLKAIPMDDAEDIVASL